MHCPDRSQPKGGAPQKGKGKPSGFKGGKGFKGKGKKAYFIEYNPTHYNDYDMSHVYVLSTVDENHVQSMAIEKAILDTGATESVAGVAMMARLIDNGLMEYTIRLDDRPSFGNGQTQRAVSKLELMTPALGKIGFYLLDDGADCTPMLIGARELRKRKAMISYKGDWLAYFLDNDWWACSLKSLRNGHLALDVLRARRPLCTLIQQFARWPDPPPGRRDDESDGEDGGDVNDPHRRKRPRGPGSSLEKLVRQETVGVGAYGGGAGNAADNKSPAAPSEVPGEAPTTPPEDRGRHEDEHIAETAPLTSRTPKTPSRRSTSPTRTPGTESAPSTPEEEGLNQPSKPIKKEKHLENKQKEVTVDATEVLTISDDEMVSSGEEKTKEKAKGRQGK